MIIISHSLISYLLYRQNPGRFHSLSDVPNRENKEKVDGQLESVTLTLLRCSRPEELIKAVKEGIKSCLPQCTGSVVLLREGTTGKVFTEDDSGRKLWLSRLHTLWDAGQPPEDQKTVLKNLDHDIADQLRKTDLAANDLTPVLCSPVLNEGGDCVVAVLLIVGEFTPESHKMLVWLKKQIAACYSHIQRTFSSTRGEEDKASQQLITLCGELYDQDAGKLQLKVIKYLEDQTQAECAFILLVVPETQELFCQVIGKKVLETEVRFPGHSSSFAVALETNQPIHLDDIPKENVSGIEEVVECTLQSFLCVPIASRSDNNLIALACLVNKTNANRFTDRDISCVQQCFRYTATVLTSTIAFQNERRLKLHSQALLQVARNLFTNLDDLTNLLREIMQQARNLTHAERCSVFLIDKETDELVAKVFDGIQANDNENEATEIRMPSTQGIAGHVATSGELLNIRDAYSHPLFYRGIDDTTGFKTRNILCFPIKDGKGTILGVAQLCNKKVGSCFTQFDEDVATAFGIYCCISINHSMMYKKVMDSQVRNTLANELMMYHMKVSPNDVVSLMTVDIPHPRLINADFIKFSYAPRLLPEDRTTLATFSMMEDLGFISRWRIKRETLARFVLMVKKGYRNPPYHNWMHAYTVGQFCYQLIRNLRLEKYFDEIELFALFVSCLCHDIDHRGTTNAFQISSKSVLAALYSSEGSVLERHHFAQTMCILNTEGCNVFENLDSKEYQQILDYMRDNILATDLQHHFDILPALRNIAERGFDKMNLKQRKLLQCLIMTSCDLSDQTKKWENAKGVAAMIYKEFFSEGDMEKARGKRPPSSFDRERVEIPTHQISFIEKVAMPVYKVLADIFPDATELVETVEENQAHWEKISNLIRLKKGGSCAKMTFEEVLAIENEAEQPREINHNEFNSENEPQSEDC